MHDVTHIFGVPGAKIDSDPLYRPWSRLSVPYAISSLHYYEATIEPRCHFVRDRPLAARKGKPCRPPAPLITEARHDQIYPVLEIEVERETGRIAVRRAVSVVDSGQPINPDGIRNQVEGGIIQSLSWTSRETATFDATRRTSFDWSTYPILRFADVPESVEIHIVNSIGMPLLGTAECAQGPTAAALANALADAVCVRSRELPPSPERIKAAIGVLDDRDRPDAPNGSGT